MAAYLVVDYWADVIHGVGEAGIRWVVKLLDVLTVQYKSYSLHCLSWWARDPSAGVRTEGFLAARADS